MHFLTLVAALALGGSTPIGKTSGTGFQTFTWKMGAKLRFQCPGIVATDRPQTPTDVHDAGVSDEQANFLLNPDPFPIQLATNQDRVVVSNVDAGTVPCNFFKVEP